MAAGEAPGQPFHRPLVARADAEGSELEQKASPVGERIEPQS